MFRLGPNHYIPVRGRAKKKGGSLAARGETTEYGFGLVRDTSAQSFSRQSKVRSPESSFILHPSAFILLFICRPLRGLRVMGPIFSTG